MSDLYRIDGLRLSIKGREILRAAQLRITSGGICCLVGPNGAGKSLALSLLAGLHEPDGGTLCYRGRPMGELRRAGGLGTEITLLHQHPFLFSRSVLANVTYGMARRDLAKAERERRARALLCRVGLDGFGGRRAGRLSTGETARVALARALGCGARTLLLDEPTAAIDQRGRQAIEEIIAEESRFEGRTVIMSTHSMDQAQRLARTILQVRNGRIRLWEPENVLSGRIVRKNGLSIFQSGRISFAIDGDTTSGKCHIGFAEGDVHIQSSGEGGPSDNAVSGRVLSIAGDNGGIRITVDAGESIAVQMKAGRYEAAGVGVGSDVRLIIPPEKVRILQDLPGKGV